MQLQKLQTNLSTELDSIDADLDVRVGRAIISGRPDRVADLTLAVGHGELSQQIEARLDEGDLHAVK